MSIKEIFYKVESHTPFLQIFQLRLVISKNTFHFYLGSSKLQNCITIAFDTIGTGEITNLFYDAKCRENGDLQRGENGTIDMIYIALFCVKSLYPYRIKKLTLEDASDIDCHGTVIALSYFKFFTIGKTWYEKHFPLKPSRAINQRITKVRGLLRQPIHITPDEFFNLLREPLEKMKQTQISHHVMHIFSKCFSQQISWLQFFSIVKDDDLLGCRFFDVPMNKMLRARFDLPNLYFSEWVLNFDRLDFSKYQIQLIQLDNNYIETDHSISQHGGRGRIQWYGKLA